MKRNRLFFIFACSFVCLNNFSLVLSQENELNKLTQQSEFIAPAEIGINEYEPIKDPLSNRTSARGNLGKSKAIPLYTKQSKLNSNKSKTKKETEFDSLWNNTKKKIENNVDNNEYNKIETFDSDGLNFERFKNSSCYDKIGFNPTWDMDSLEKEYQDCESEYNFKILMNIIYVTLFLIIISVIVIFSLPKKRNNSDV